MEKINGSSMDIKNDNIEMIRKLFPNVVKEGKIDFDLLRTILGDDIDSSKEKFQFSWNGKTESIKMAQATSSTTLRPCKEKSKEWDSTNNIYIEGDNLEALKQLQKTYHGAIKMIYIDPPYNTGGDFVYKDDFSNSIDNYIKQTNQSNTSNPETSGRYHTDWLNMMYPRLMLARNLLSNDGAIFISIDDNELFNLKKICDEIFGEANFINAISVKMSELSGVKMKHLNKYAKLKETLLIYAKDSSVVSFIIEKKKKDKATLVGYLKYYSNIIVDKSLPCEKWVIVPLNKYFADNNISINNDEELHEWKISNAESLIYRTNSKTVDKFIENNPDAPEICSLINDDGKEIVKWGNKEMLFLDKYIDEYLGDIWTDISTINVNKENDAVVFANGQKPLSLMKRIIKSLDMRGETVLDFFSGSGTTAHATMLLNQEDGLGRKFIMVQLPEPTDSNTEAYKKGYKTICDIGEDRIRKAGEKIVKEHKLPDTPNMNVDTGFKVFKLDSSNIIPWDNSHEYDEQSIFSAITVFKPERNKDDILYELMLKYGVFDMTTSEIEVNKKRMFKVGLRHMIVCLEDSIDSNDISEIAKLEPKVVVFREDGFKDDNEKINAEYNLKRAGVEEVKCI